MKIGFFTECYKPVMNGVVVSIDTFRKSLEAKGHEVFVFAPENEKAEADDHVFRFPSIADKKGRLYPVTFPSIELVKHDLPEDIIKDLDVIHAQHMFTEGRLARYVAEKFNKPLVYTYHTLIAEYTHYAGFLSPVAKWYLRNMSRRFCNSCDKIITPSNPMKKVLKSYGVKKPIEVIMTGIEPTNYKKLTAEERGEILKKWKIDPDKKILLYLSRIAREKNIDFLFRSFKRIIIEYPDCHLIMAGGGPEEEWCHNRVKELKIDQHVTFTGMLPKEEANKYFGLADLFTFPSVSETQGIVIAEAMASGTPPVAVGKMGPVDLIHDSKDGYLTKEKIGDFTEKVLDLLQDDEKRAQFAESGLARIQEFSTETSTNKLEALYLEMIEMKKGELSKAEALAD